MKKIALILALVMVFACALAACDPAETTSDPADESVAANESSVADVSDESTPADEASVADESDESVPGEESDAPVADSSVLSVGKTYTYTSEGLYYHSNAEWTVSQNVATALTDGVFEADYYGSESMTGWLNSDPEIVIDLGASKKVNSFKYYAFGGMDGILLPASVEVSVSADGENWTSLTCTSIEGEQYASTLTWVTGQLVEFTLNAASSADAQYVKFNFTRDGLFAFLSEVEVYGE